VSKVRGIAEELVPVKISKVTSNDSTTLIYLGKRIERLLGLKKRDQVVLYIDKKRRRLIVEKVPPLEGIGEEG